MMFLGRGTNRPNSAGKKSNEDSEMAISQLCTPQNSLTFSFSLDAGLMDKFSQNDIYSLKVEELNELIDKLNHLERECSQIQDRSRSSYSSNLSRRKNEEYNDILNKKQSFTDKLVNAIKSRSNIHNGVPQYRIQCYENLASLMKTQNDVIKQEVHQDKEQLNKLKTELNRENSQNETFSNLMVEGNNSQEKKDNCLRKINIHFQEIRKDMDTVLSKLLTDNMKDEFSSVMKPLMEAYVNNMENKEMQYIEISPRSLKNRALKCLTEDNIVVRHPSKAQFYCLCIEK